MKNKKGVEINITTIIILVLAILVLVIIALAFTGGLKQLWYKIIGVDVIYNQDAIDMAKSLCESRDSVSFCTQPIDLPKQSGGSDKILCYAEPIKAELKYLNNQSRWKTNPESVTFCKETYG